MAESYRKKIIENILLFLDDCRSISFQINEIELSLQQELNNLIKRLTEITMNFKNLVQSLFTIKIDKINIFIN